MNARQKWGLGFIIQGVLTAALGVFCAATNATPEWFTLLLNVTSMAGPALGVVINLPSNTNPQ